jgi:hypothetical protein
VHEGAIVGVEAGGLVGGASPSGVMRQV